MLQQGGLLPRGAQWSWLYLQPRLVRCQGQKQGRKERKIKTTEAGWVENVHEKIESWRWWGANNEPEKDDCVRVRRLGSSHSCSFILSFWLSTEEEIHFILIWCSFSFKSSKSFWANIDPPVEISLPRSSSCLKLHCLWCNCSNLDRLWFRMEIKSMSGCSRWCNGDKLVGQRDTGNTCSTGVLQTSTAAVYHLGNKEGPIGKPHLWNRL